MLHHCNIPDKAHKKNLAITLHTDNIFHERYFHFFSFFSPQKISLKNHKVEKKHHLIQATIQMSLQYLMSYGLHIVFSTAGWVSQLY